jgi:plasmid stabilization system protein ParE
MQKPSAKQVKLSLRWSITASRSFTLTLQRVAAEDATAAAAILQRVERSLAALVAQPGIGTLTAKRQIRRYPIPNTGHTIDYAVVEGRLEVRRWFRQRRQA